MKKSVRLLIIIFVVLLLIASIALLWRNKNLPIPTSKTGPTSASTSTETPIPQPAYSVTILSQPILGGYGFSFTAQIRNVSVKPYITDLGFLDCIFIDSTNTTYKGTLNAGIRFDKALLPSQSKNAEFKDTSAMYLNNGAHLSDFTYQSRNADGEIVTKSIKGLKIVSCTANISTNDTSVSMVGEGEMPLTVKFP